MMQESEPDKRIVSKGEYAAKMSKKVTIGTFGLFCIGIGALLFCAMCLSLTCTRNGRLDIRSIPLTISFCVFAGVAGYFGTRLFQTAERIEPGIPVTRANTGDLPAPDSLVRASVKSLFKHRKTYCYERRRKHRSGMRNIY